MKVKAYTEISKTELLEIINEFVKEYLKIPDIIEFTYIESFTNYVPDGLIQIEPQSDLNWTRAEFEFHSVEGHFDELSLDEILCELVFANKLPEGGLLITDE